VTGKAGVRCPHGHTYAHEQTFTVLGGREVVRACNAGKAPVRCQHGKEAPHTYQSTCPNL